MAALTPQSPPTSPDRPHPMRTSTALALVSRGSPSINGLSTPTAAEPTVGMTPDPRSPLRESPFATVDERIEDRLRREDNERNRVAGQADLDKVEAEAMKATMAARVAAMVAERAAAEAAAAAVEAVERVKTLTMRQKHKRLGGRKSKKNRKKSRRK